MDAVRPHVLLSKTTIKPSSQIPNRLSTINLTLLDQIMPDIYLSWILFYPKVENVEWSRDKATSLLKNSLSMALSQYYPFAGKLIDQEHIECNDEGVDFLEAEIPCTLSSFLKNIEPKTLELFDVLGSPWNCSCEHSSLLVVSVSYFECGGLAICTSLQHQIGDGITLTNFIDYWSITARRTIDGQVTLPQPPLFISSMFAPSTTQTNPTMQVHKYVTQRFVFEPSKLSDLKAVVTEAGVSNPSEIEVVKAILLKCLMDAASDDSNLPLLFESVNMRSRTTPTISNNSVGNFTWYCVVPPTNRESGNNLHSLVAAMRKGLQEFDGKYTKDATTGEFFESICTSIREMISQPPILEPKKDINVYTSNSTCEFTSYKIDFGWGTPVWAAIYRNAVMRASVLLDAATPGGIEAWVALLESEMEIVQRNPELLAFASLNPSPILETI